MKKLNVGLLGIGIVLLIVMASGCTSSGDDNSTTAKSSAPAINMTVNKLYTSAPAVGTNVQVTGTVLQSASDMLIIRDSNLKTVYVSLDSSNTKTAYEDQKVTVVGTFSGPHEYTTVQDAAKSIPGLDNAKVV